MKHFNTTTFFWLICYTLFLDLCLVSKEKLIPGLSGIVIESFKNFSSLKLKNNYNGKVLNTLSVKHVIGRVVLIQLQSFLFLFWFEKPDDLSSVQITGFTGLRGHSSRKCFRSVNNSFLIYTSGMGSFFCKFSYFHFWFSWWFGQKFFFPKCK